MLVSQVPQLARHWSETTTACCTAGELRVLVARRESVDAAFCNVTSHNHSMSTASRAEENVEAMIHGSICSNFLQITFSSTTSRKNSHDHASNNKVWLCHPTKAHGTPGCFYEDVSMYQILLPVPHYQSYS